MSHVVVTLEYDRGKIDLALPMHVPSGLLIEGILEILKLSQQDHQLWLLGVKEEGRIRRIPRHVSLGEAEVLHGAILTLIGEEVVVPTEGAFLRSADGRVFPLKEQGVWVLGRNDPQSGIVVDIDVSAVASKPLVVSRLHARIEQEGEHYYLVDLHSTNRTFLNGKEVPPGERHLLHDGDVIELGPAVVQLTFCHS